MTLNLVHGSGGFTGVTFSVIGETQRLQVIGGAAYFDTPITGAVEIDPTMDHLVVSDASDVVAFKGGPDELRSLVKRMATVVGLQVNDPPPDPRVVDLERICDLFKQYRPGVSCYVEQTGGGCATIYCGERYPVGEDGDTAVPVMAGPGWFDGPGWTKGRAHLDDFSVGYDTCMDPHLDGGPPDSQLIWGEAWVTAEDKEQAIAEALVRLHDAHPRVRPPADAGFLALLVVVVGAFLLACLAAVVLSSWKFWAIVGVLMLVGLCVPDKNRAGRR